MSTNPTSLAEVVQAIRAMKFGNNGASFAQEQAAAIVERYAAAQAERAAPEVEREAFEAFCVRRWRGDRNALGRNSDDHEKHPGEYTIGNVEFAWQAWQARAALASAQQAAPSSEREAQLRDALHRMVESITGVDQVSAVNEARAALDATSAPAAPEPAPTAPTAQPATEPARKHGRWHIGERALTPYGIGTISRISSGTGFTEYFFADLELPAGRFAVNERDMWVPPAPTPQPEPDTFAQARAEVASWPAELQRKARETSVLSPVPISAQPEPAGLDVCTDATNCQRCKASPWDKHKHFHAGIQPTPAAQPVAQAVPRGWLVTQGTRTFYVPTAEFVRSSYDSGSFHPLYDAPPPAQAVPTLTDAEIDEDQIRRFAVHLCEKGGNDPHELLWEDGQPWGERWMKYEPQARAIVRAAAAKGAA